MLMIMNIPKDPAILLSFINTRLRDDYTSLDELCASLGLERGELDSKLALIDYHYSETENQFL